ncbi:hypothetical protein EDB89DRAFT_1902820 [Lactarius sanguifluus]|nr:hypothetical protein EDB89DRAFT_1902820 [Lactarius sanguifluus]
MYALAPHQFSSVVCQTCSVAASSHPLYLTTVSSCHSCHIHSRPKQLQPNTFTILVITQTKFHATPKRARSLATTLIPSSTMPVPDPPDLATFARGPRPSTPTRPRSPWTYIRQLALRGGPRDTEQRFIPPKPCCGHNRFNASPVKDQFGLVCGPWST